MGKDMVKSWWIPDTVSSFNSGLSTLKCQVQVVSRMILGFLMILVIAYLLLQRGATSRSTMPITFILLLLGVFCGFAGKLCVDTLRGSGYLWLLYWESLCLLHFFTNICTPLLFLILHGPVNVSQEAKSRTIIPYWVRRSLFYSSLLLFVPFSVGLCLSQAWVSGKNTYRSCFQFISLLCMIEAGVRCAPKICVSFISIWCKLVFGTVYQAAQFVFGLNLSIWCKLDFGTVYQAAQFVFGLNNAMGAALFLVTVNYDSFCLKFGRN